MADQDKQFDPANPENKAITDGMERDGEMLRDLREGRTPTEQAFGVDLGTDPLQALHEEILQELGEVVAQENAETPTEEIQQQHDILLKELSQTVANEAARVQRPTTTVRAKAEQRASERKARLSRPQRQARQLQAEHGELFAELGEVVEKAEPDDPTAGLPPDAAARVAHPGEEKPDELGKAFGEFATEDKAWRAEAAELFRLMATEIAQSRLELDQIRGFLERSRL